MGSEMVCRIRPMRYLFTITTRLFIFKLPNSRAQNCRSAAQGRQRVFGENVALGVISAIFLPEISMGQIMFELFKEFLALGLKFLKRLFSLLHQHIQTRIIAKVDHLWLIPTVGCQY